MRREREEYPLQTPEEKEQVRLIQVENCSEKAKKANLQTLSEQTRQAYKAILDLQEEGVDFADPMVREEHKILLSYASPVLQYGMSAAYLDRAFDALRTRCALGTSSSFSLGDIESSPDSANLAESRQTLDIFDGCEDAELILQNASPIYAFSMFLHSLSVLNKPLFPSLRRDLAARTGELEDLSRFLGGARIWQPTSIMGVRIFNDYELGVTEYPDVRVAVQPLR